MSLRPSRLLVMAFCFFHMAATAVYAIPDSASDPVSDGLKLLHPIIDPYILMTSQWQKWDLFSPEPPAGEHVWRMEAERNDRWETVFILDHASLGWRRSENELAALRKLVALGDRTRPILSRYIQSFCRTFGLEKQTSIRLTVSPNEGSAILAENVCDASPEELTPITLPST